MKLCEELELNGIEVVSANTDGIVVKLYKRKIADFDRIVKEWETLTGFSADSEDYMYYINSDINNYLIQELNGKVSYKGSLNPNMYAIDLQKGYDMPIVATAVTNFLLYNKPILDTLREETNILEFCKSQNVNRKYTLEFSKGSTVTKVQNKTRFYVSTNGGYLDKVANNGAERNSLCKDQKVTVLNSLDDTPISERNINYTYYFKEARKIIDPIKLGIDPNQKGNAKHKIKSGKKAIEQLTGMYEKLFEDLDDDVKLFEVTIMNNELTKPLYDLMHLLNRQNKDQITETIDSISNKLLQLIIEAGIGASVVACELIINRLIRSEENIYKRPDFSKDKVEPYTILTVSKSLEKNSSPLIGLSFQNIKRQLLSNEMFEDRDETSYIDELYKTKISTKKLSTYAKYANKEILGKYV